MTPLTSFSNGANDSKLDLQGFESCALVGHSILQAVARSRGAFQHCGLHHGGRIPGSSFGVAKVISLLARSINLNLATTKILDVFSLFFFGGGIVKIWKGCVLQIRSHNSLQAVSPYSWDVSIQHVVPYGRRLAICRTCLVNPLENRLQMADVPHLC